jgi:hypothetical protein
MCWDILNPRINIFNLSRFGIKLGLNKEVSLTPLISKGNMPLFQEKASKIVVLSNILSFFHVTKWAATKKKSTFLICPK